MLLNNPFASVVAEASAAPLGGLREAWQWPSLLFAALLLCQHNRAFSLFLAILNNQEKKPQKQTKLNQRKCLQPHFVLWCFFMPFPFSLLATSWLFTHQVAAVTYSNQLVKEVRTSHRVLVCCSRQLHSCIKIWLHLRCFLLKREQQYFPTSQLVCSILSLEPWKAETCRNRVFKWVCDQKVYPNASLTILSPFFFSWRWWAWCLALVLSSQLASFLLLCHQL